jgi:putative hydrolase of HD superfamily
MKKPPSLQRLIEFNELLNQFAAIERIVHIKRHDEYVLESDTEHSYNLAMSAWFLAGYFPELDKDKVIRTALVHDLVEVYAGDTYVFADQSQLDSKKEREALALKRLTAEWTDFAEYIAELTAYEERLSAEAKFVYALDKIMPIIQIYLHDGHTWQKEGTDLARLHANKRDKVTVSPQIQPYYDELYELLTEHGHLFA